MKKSVLFVFGLLVFAIFSSSQVAAQSPAITSESANVKITYGQPSKKGREIFGKLVPYGQVWRTGANSATEVTFKKDVNFGGKSVKAGTYSLFTIPNQGDWEVILNSELKQWGAYGYEKVKDKNVTQIKVKSMKTDAEVEKLTITASDSEIKIEWDTTVVKIALKW
jgi:hypothetical protein